MGIQLQKNSFSDICETQQYRLNMNIYSVIRYGNDDEGPDGADTEFLILAGSVEEAAKLADIELKKLPHKNVSFFCNAVTLVGKSFSNFEKSIVLMGPVNNKNSRLSLGVPEKNIWKRCEHTGSGPWVPFDDY